MASEPPFACSTPDDLSASADVSITASDRVLAAHGHARFEAWTLDGDVPGPVLRIPLGETRRVKLVNRTTRTMSLHFVGLQTSFEDDGTMDSPKSVVGAGCAHVYTVRAIAPGVWPFLSHIHPREGLVHGQYGAVVVPSPDEAPADREYVLFMGQLGFESEGPGGDGDEAPTAGPFAMTVNGRAMPSSRVIAWKNGRYEASNGIPVARVGERVRWRLLNTSPDVVHTFGLHSHMFCAGGGAIDASGACPLGRRATSIFALTPLEGTSFESIERVPGHWMLHCHVLDHVEDGMMGYFDVAP